jgi:hypothetical protein
MKNFRFIQLPFAIAVILLLAGFAASSIAADKKAASDPGASGVPPTLHGPQSAFNLTGKIKDPFFPRSTRTNPVVITNLAPLVVTPSSFTLKGISGAEGNRLVLINNKNFAEGESDFVETTAGKKKITVMKILEFSAIVKAEGFPDSFELSLPKSFR